MTGPDMDETRVDQVVQSLQGYGLLEIDEKDLRGTPRWRAKLQASAEKLNLVAARTGQPPAGNPLVIAATQALASENLQLPQQDFDDHVLVLVLVELSHMTPAKRATAGFPDILFPGEQPANAGSSVDY